LCKLLFQFRQFPRQTLSGSQSLPKVPDQFPMGGHDVLLGGAKISFPRRRILKNCEAFQDNPDLLKSPSPIHSTVNDEVLRRFLAVLDRPRQSSGQQI
jgi:hypothetical protein